MNHNATVSVSIYSPLDSDDQQIRLLEVSPTLTDGLISCRLTTHPLKSAGYVVLSYQWGSLSTTYPILLNGRTFYVRANLFGFLNEIRVQDDFLLWIDALCINQQDLEERSRQVQIMGSIFCGARMVLSWLGPKNSTIEQAFDLMNEVWSSVERASREELQGDEELLPTTLDDSSQGDLWASVVSLCELPYWNRVWVVQEILLSSNNYLMCGSKTLTWQMFANFMTLVGVRFKCPAEFAKDIQGSIAQSYAVSKPYVTVPQRMQWKIGHGLLHDYGKAWNTGEYNLFRVLTMFGNRDCTDALDHVYALLSLTSESDQLVVKYGIDKMELLLRTFHFCGWSATRDNSEQQRSSHPATVLQRALIRNARFLAELLEILPVHHQQHTTPYFYGATADPRHPNPRPDPCFPSPGQTLYLRCTPVLAGQEPPVLRSNTLRRSIGSIPYDTIFHVDESKSWLLCREHSHETHVQVPAAVITLKNGAHGQTFRVLKAGELEACPISACDPASSTSAAVWEMSVPAEAHLHFLYAIIVGASPTD